MADIQRGGMHPLVEKNLDLKIQYYEIILNEKKNQLGKLKNNLEELKTVNMKRIEHTIEVTKREITNAEQELKLMKQKFNAIDVENKK